MRPAGPSITRSWLSWVVISLQPPFSSPTSMEAGTRTLSKYVAFTWCAPSQVAAFLPKIKLHEGVTFDPDSSHAGILRKALAAARPAAILEGFVANVSGQSPARAIGLRLDAVFGPTMASTLATADDVKDGGTVKEIIVPCNLNFYHP